MWYLDVSGTDVSIKNVLTDRYVKGQGTASAQYQTDTYSTAFTVGESDGAFTFKYDPYGFYSGGLHCDANLNVVQYDVADSKSKWTLQSAEVDASALAAQKAAKEEASLEKLTNYFTDGSCTSLKSAQSSYSDELLISTMSNDVPQTVIDMALKVKNSAWTTYDGWDKTERSFRIGSYKAYSKHDRWSNIIGCGHVFGRLTNPTGIYATSGEYLYVYVGTIPSGQNVMLEVAGAGQGAGVTYNLHEGMNTLLMASSGNCYVLYEVDNTTSGKAPYTAIDSYPAITVHIEGGDVQGYFDLTKGDDNNDWANLQKYLLKNPTTVELKTNNLLFHMSASLVTTACPTSMVELLGEWDKILDMEYSLMGLEDFDGYWNNLLGATDITGDSYMYATNYGTYYHTSTISSVMSYEDMFGGGAIWGPAHENGHIFQKYINMIGQTEVSNNMFSNVAVYNNGHLTSRATNISTTFENMANNVFWNDRGIWERTHLYFQLYQFFHILNKKAAFYPKLFKALRNDPMIHTGNTFVSATDDYLKFYKKCCQVSGYDLTEFFQAYGFFVIPSLTSYVIDGVTKDAYKVEDYANYYLTITQSEIDAAKQAVADMKLPKANIIFIEDRITAPDATYEGAGAGAKKIAFSSEFPIGQAGETGQYTDFGATCSAYKYNVKEGVVTMEGTGAVGFKVYDNTGNLRGLYNTYSFNLPDAIGTGYTIKAAAGDGTDTTASYDASIGIIASDVEDVLGVGAKITAEDQLVSGKLYLLRNTATGDPWITDAGTYYSVGNNGGTFDKYCMYYLIQDGDGTWKIKNYMTEKYWGKPIAASTTNQGGFVPTEEADAGSWSLNFNDNGNINPSCNGFYINRASQKMHAWSSSLSSQIYEVNTTYPPFSEFDGKDIRVSPDAAASLQTNQWYVMFDRGANHGYLYENNSNKLYNTATVPSGSATSNAKYLVRIVGWDNEYYIQTGLGNFFGNIQQSTPVSTTAITTEKITIKKIADTDGHFYLMSAAGVVLDANALTNGDATVVGWGTTAPTTTGGNNDWAFYPVEFVDSWIPTINEVYTINNTNTNRGALIYNPEASTKYVWSSGKSGTFNASNANSQWVIISTETENQYYLYNVGAGKFAIPTGIAQSASNSWIFSDNAVAVIFEKQNDGTKKIRMASNPVSGTNAAYMAVSNNYTGPIINYNDVGGNFTITKVDGDASAAANTTVAKLVKNQTDLSAAVTANDGWYVIRIKTTTNSTATASPGRYIYAGTTNQTNYPLTFTGGIDVQPSISDATFYTRFVKNGNDYNWQLANGQYLVNRSNVFPTASNEPVAVIPGYDNGCYIKSNGRFADPYVNNGNFFIGETSSYRTTWNIYPIDLEAAGLTAWQMVCDNAPETAEISCTRTDVVGLTSAYKNGYIFLPAGVTPVSSDFVLDGAIDASVDADAKTVTLNYNPNLAIVAGGVNVMQGYQTAGRGEEVMLLRVNAAPFRDATGVTLSVSLKDGSASGISKLTLYEASTSSPEILSAGNEGAPARTLVATADVTSASVTLNIGNLSAGNHYYWLAADVREDAVLGAVLDAAVTGISYTCNDNRTDLDLTDVGDPAARGAMVFNTHTYPFLPRQNGSRVYRIPAMVVADDGSIIVACDKRYDSYTDIGAGHVIDIVIRRSTDGGKTWSAPVTIAKGQGNGDEAKCGYGDPSLVKGKDGKLYCLFVAGNIGYFYGQKRIAMSTSTDNGVTWSSNESTPPIDLLESGRLQNYNTVGEAGYGLYDYFVTSGRGLYIPEDDILMYLIPGQTMTSATEHTGDSQDYLFYSTDGGMKWYFSERPMVQGGDEAKVIRMNDGSLFGSIRKGGSRRFNTATYTRNDDGTLSFSFGTQWDNNQLTQSSQNNQDILYYQRETVTGKRDYIFHSITTGNHANLKLYYSTDQGRNWTEFLNIQTRGARYVTMDKSGTEENPGSLYLFYEDQSLNEAGGYTDYNHYPLNFLEITREQLLQYIPELDKSALEEEVKIVSGTSGETAFGAWDGSKTVWTSNAASGRAGLKLTKSGGSFDKFSSWNGHYNLAYKPAAANTASTLTLTAPEGYVIKGFSMLASKSSSATHTFTLKAADGTTVTPAFASSASGYTSFSTDNLFTPGTTIDVTTTDGSKYIAIADFVVTLVPVTTYERDVTPDRWGTICVPGAVAAEDITGADIYSIVGKVTDESAKPVELKVQQVTAMEAGKPYLFLAKGDKLTLTYYGNTVVNKPQSENGLIGSFTGTEVEEGYYVLSDNTIVLCGKDCSIAGNRAYINMDEVPVFDGSAAGVRSLNVIADEETAINSLTPALSQGEGDAFDLSGRKVNSNSEIKKGIYIKNGKKVLY